MRKHLYSHVTGPTAFLKFFIKKKNKKKLLSLRTRLDGVDKKKLEVKKKQEKKDIFKQSV